MFLGELRTFLVLVLLLGIGCSSQNGKQAIREAQDSPSSRRVKELESQINEVETRIGDLESRLLYATATGVLIVGAGFFLLWKRGNNRKRDVGRLKSRYDRLKKDVRGAPDMSASKWSQSTEDTSPSGSTDDVARLKNKVESLEKKVENLRAQIEDPHVDSAHHSEMRGSQEHFPQSSGAGASPGEQREVKEDPLGDESDSHSPSGSDPQKRSGNRTGVSKSSGSSGVEPRESLEDDYNRLLHDDISEQTFNDRYAPIPLGIGNEEERLSDDGAPVVLQQDEKGRYRAVEEEDYYLVFPQPGIMIEDAIRREAGFDEVFQCDKFDHNHPYEVRRLDKAARFVGRRGETLNLEAPGKIDLRRYGG